MNTKQTPEDRHTRRPLQRLVRRAMKKLMVFAFLLDAGPIATEEQLWWLRTSLRSWNRWPKKGWSAHTTMPRSLRNRSNTRPTSISLMVNIISGQSGNTMPAQGCKTQSSAEQGCEWATNLWKEITEPRQQSTPQKGWPQTPLCLLLFPYVPNAAGQWRREKDEQHET